MCSEALPKEFEKSAEVLPLSNCGLSSIDSFRRAENELSNLEWLKKVGLSKEEIKLYQDNESGLLDQRKKIESNALKSQLDAVYEKINNFKDVPCSSKQNNIQPSTSKDTDILDKTQNKPLQIYPEGHPMNDIKDLEQNLFGHLKTDKEIPLTKRRKLLRRLERKRERILSQQKQLDYGKQKHETVNRPGSLWDVQHMPERIRRAVSKNSEVIGPRKRTMYTIRDNKIMRLEPIQKNREVGERVQEYNAVDIVVPENEAEEELLEGTKMCIDDIRKIERFKDYKPGIPSKVLYLKNISPSVTQEQLSLLFNQFVLDNGGPVDLRLMTGRMRGQAFVAFQNEDLAIQALDEINGTILSGQPIIAQFGRNSNRIQNEENR